MTTTAHHDTPSSTALVLPYGARQREAFGARRNSAAFRRPYEQPRVSPSIGASPDVGTAIPHSKTLPRASGAVETPVGLGARWIPPLSPAPIPRKGEAGATCAPLTRRRAPHPIPCALVSSRIPPQGPAPCSATELAPDRPPASCRPHPEPWRPAPAKKSCLLSQTPWTRTLSETFRAACLCITRAPAGILTIMRMKSSNAWSLGASRLNGAADLGCGRLRQFGCLAWPADRAITRSGGPVSGVSSGRQALPISRNCLGPGGKCHRIGARTPLSALLRSPAALATSGSNSARFPLYGADGGPRRVKRNVDLGVRSCSAARPPTQAALVRPRSCRFRATPASSRCRMTPPAAVLCRVPNFRPRLLPKATENHIVRKDL
jgi:hypothetical protein